ncbi:MAG TPA: hypothetical protein VIL09_07715 [Microvirga sp.]|jgi:cell division protein FtsB
MTGSASLDKDNLRRLDELRRTYDRLRTERIRAEGEVERLGREADQAREEARAEFGTDDEAEIRRLIEAAQAENARLVASFGSLLADIETRLKRLEDEAS